MPFLKARLSGSRLKGAVFSSLRVRLILLVSFALLPALGLLLYQVREQRNDAREAVQTEALRLVQLVAVTQQEEVHGSRQLLRILAQHPAISGERDLDCDRVVSDLLPQNTVYANFGVADMNGQVTCSALPLPGPVTVADRSYFQGALNTGDFYVGEFQIGRVTRMPTVSTAYPLIDSSGQAHGVVFAVLDLSRLGSLAAQVDLPAGSTLTVVDRSGTVLVRHPDPEGFVGKAFPEAMITRAISGGTEPGIYEGPGLDGRERLYAWTPLVSGGDASGVVLVGIPESVAFAGVNGIIYRSIAALAVVVVAIAAISRFFGSAFIIRPARALVGATKRLATGDLQARSGISHQEGEFGELARAFDDMAQSLQERAEALRESEEKYRTLAEAAHDVIFLVNKELHVEYVNDFGAKMRGLPQGEVVGKHVSEVFPEQGVSSALASSLQEVIQTERPLYRERAMTFQGHPVWLGTWLSPIRDASGQVRAVLGISRDITERKQVQEALRQTSQMLESVVAASPIAIISSDLDGTVILWNPAAKRIFGWSAEEVVGRTIPMVSEATRRDMLYRLAHLPSDTFLTGLDLKRRRKDGSLVDVSLSGAALRDAEGRAIGAIGMLIDITERKRADAALRLRTQELEALFTIASLLAQPKSFEEKASEVMEELRRVTGSARVALRVTDEKAQGLRLVAEANSREFTRGDVAAVIPYGQGIAGAALRSGQTFVTNDYVVTPDAYAPRVQEEVKSGLALPIKSGDQVRAILALLSTERGHFTPERVALLSAIADELGVLLENARLYQEVKSALESRRRRIEAFQTIAAKLALEELPEQSLQQLVDTARELLEARYAAFAVWEDRKGMLYWFVSGLSPEEQQAIGSPPTGKGILRLVRESGAAVRLRDLRTHPAAVGVPSHHPPMGSFLGVPVFFKRRSVGAFYLTNKANGTEFTDEDEQLLYLFAVLAGVVLENRNLYGQVSQERNMLAAIQASITEGLVVLDQRGRILFHNPMAEQMSGVPSKSAEGKLPEELFQLASMEFEPTEGFKAMLGLLKDPPESPQTMEITLVRPQRRELSITAFPIPLESDERLLGLVIHDVTEAKDLDRRKDAFVSIASHELRTPMSSIMGFTELLLQRDPSPSVRKEWLERIQRNTKRVAAIVDDLLNVSRIQSGKLVLTVEPLSLPGLLDEVMPIIQPLTDKHEFVIAIPSECPLVLADRDKLNQVLTNLLDNAVKYSPKGGAITVAARFDAERGHVVLSVADHGMGIAREDQERLFTTFSRIRRPETAGIRGTGLGLFIVKGLVELMKGQVWMESDLGRGSTFYVSLPAVAP